MAQTGDSLWGLLRNSFDKGGADRVRDITITTAQLLALNATPITIVPAPGANRFNLLKGILLHKPSGVAYAGIAGGEDLEVKYTSASGLEVARIETTGFLDQTTAQTRYLYPYAAASAVNDITPTVNAVFVMGLISGEITTGDSDLLLRIFYNVVPSVLT